MNNPEKLATGTQDKEKEGKNTTQYVHDTTMHKQTQMTNRTSVLCGNRNEHHNTEL
jgi:hypothetical protein